METLPLGSTGLAVSPIGLGLAALGRPGYINLGHGADLETGRSVAAMRARAESMLEAAYVAGVRYFDAARSYGRAEEFLAGWLEARDHSVTVGSKWGYTYTAGWDVDAAVHEVKDHSLAAFERQLAETGSLLGDRLDLYQVHSATLDTGVLEDEALHRRLGQLRDTGVTVGLSTSGPRQRETILRALGIEIDGHPLFGAMQATWNLFETSAAPALAAAAAAGRGVIVKEALANGRLTHRNQELPPVLATHDAPDAVALAAALSQPWVSVVLSGATTREQLASNLHALTLTDLPDLAHLAEDPDRYWALRSSLPWT